MSNQSSNSASASGQGVLFLSGAGLPDWIWDQVRTDLPAHLETAVARYPRGENITLANYADAVAANAPWSEFTVVAHSIGGVVATELVARHPERISGVLGVAAVFPRAGRSFVQSMPIPARYVLGPLMKVAGTRPPAKAIRSLATGAPTSVGDKLVADFDPEAIGLYCDRASARDWPPLTGYLRTSADSELSLAIQRKAGETLNATWVKEVSTGHLPMIEAPNAVTRAVQRMFAQAQA